MVYILKIHPRGGIFSKLNLLGKSFKSGKKETENGKEKKEKRSKKKKGKTSEKKQRGLKKSHFQDFLAKKSVF